MTEGVHPYRVEPDRGFADRLERELVGRLVVGRPDSAPATEPEPMAATLPKAYTDPLGVGGSTVTVIDMTPEPVRGGPRFGRRALLLVAAAAALVLVAASVVVLVARDDPTDVEIPAGPSPVSVGPSPTGAEGAPLAVAGSGELVAALDQMGVGMDLPGYERTDPRHIYVYADGRVITSINYSPFGFAAGRTRATGFVEQRLTPEGVEVVRAEILSTGLFDAGSPPPNSELMAHDDPANPAATGTAFGIPPVIRVSDGERFLSLPKKLDQEWTDEFQRLQDRLWDLPSWLPASAWADTTRTPFVSSMYTACRSYTARGEPPPDVLAALPAPAVELFPAQQPAITLCVDLTVDEARQLGEVLQAAGLTQSGAIPGPFEVSTDSGVGNVSIRSRAISVDLTPQLPHGEPAQCCGGIG